MDPSNRNESQFSLVIAEQSTGVVLDPKTLKKWYDRSGTDYHLRVATLEDARQLAAKIISDGTELEVWIRDSNGQFVEMVRNEWVDPEPSPANIERREPRSRQKPQAILTPTLLYVIEAGICVAIGGLLGYELIPINLGADGWLVAYPQQKLQNLLFGATLGAVFFLFLWAFDQRPRV